MLLSSSTLTSLPMHTLPKKLTRWSCAIRVNWLMTFWLVQGAQTVQQVALLGSIRHPVVHLQDLTLVSAWSGATPVLTRPNGDGSRSCAGTVNEAGRRSARCTSCSVACLLAGHTLLTSRSTLTSSPNCFRICRSRHISQFCPCPCVSPQMHASAHTPCPQCRTQQARCQQRTHSGAAAAARCRITVLMRAEGNERFCCCRGP